MTISLTPEFEALVNAKVASGLYPSVSEALLDGLRLLKEKDADQQARQEELRRELQKGIDSLERGEATVYASGEELAAHIEAKGRKLLAERASTR